MMADNQGTTVSATESLPSTDLTHAQQNAAAELPEEVEVEAVSQELRS